uniref:Uncharacterized protein n=1 Tax=Grammatophora oceanica TaxID=210454 RepID=A0A7S1VTJ3_9STRA
MGDEFSLHDGLRSFASVTTDEFDNSTIPSFENESMSDRTNDQSVPFSPWRSKMSANGSHATGPKSVASGTSFLTQSEPFPAMSALSKGTEPTDSANRDYEEGEVEEEKKSTEGGDETDESKPKMVPYKALVCVCAFVLATAVTIAIVGSNEVADRVADRGQEATLRPTSVPLPLPLPSIASVPPSQSPSVAPSLRPSITPSRQPSHRPTLTPSAIPSSSPSKTVYTLAPTRCFYFFPAFC